MNKICIITTSRADKNILNPLIEEIKNDSDMELELPMSLSDKLLMPLSISNSAIVVVVGDRLEILKPVICAIEHKIPVAHIHGGELTYGTVDELVRHAVTKMSHLHFTSTEDYRRRVIQMGEHPDRVYNVGAMALDILKTFDFTDKVPFHSDFDNGNPIALVTYHAPLYESLSVEEQIENVLSAIDESKVNAIFTSANTDVGGKYINQVIQRSCDNSSHKFKYISNLGTDYYKYLNSCDLMIGNSSSGIIEATSFGLPVVNIGDRQKGRIQGNNIINVECKKENIRAGIFVAPRLKTNNYKNPYLKSGNAAKNIKDVIKIHLKQGINLQKKFYDAR